MKHQTNNNVKLYRTTTSDESSSSSTTTMGIPIRISNRKQQQYLLWTCIFSVFLYAIMTITIRFRFSPSSSPPSSSNDEHLIRRNLESIDDDDDETTTTMKTTISSQQPEDRLPEEDDDDEREQYETTIRKLTFELERVRTDAKEQITTLQDELHKLQIRKLTFELERLRTETRNEVSTLQHELKALRERLDGTKAVERQKQPNLKRESNNIEPPPPPLASSSPNAPFAKHATTTTTTTTPRPHPYAGAKDPSGQWGYIHDPTVLHRNPLPFTIPVSQYGEICAPPAHGPEGPGGYRLLTEKITIDHQTNNNNNNVTTNNNNNNTPTPRIKLFCAVYTHSGATHLLHSILETWGQRCDGFMAASNDTLPPFGIVNIPHKGKEEYRSIWQKVRSMWAYIHDHFLEEYDFFHMSGDDTYVIVENLRAFLESEGVVRDGGGEGYPNPLYIGHWFMLTGNKTYFAGGGSGYTLNRAALSHFVTHLLDTCIPNLESHAEDRFMGFCFRKSDIVGYDARDSVGEHRYHGFDPEFVYSFRPYQHFHGKDRAVGFWSDQTKGMPDKFGLEAASKGSVAFHLMKTPAKMRRIHKILYRRGERDCAVEDEFGSVVVTEEELKLLPHKDCRWNNEKGEFETCPEYEKIKHKMPPDGWTGES